MLELVGGTDVSGVRTLRIGAALDAALRDGRIRSWRMEAPGDGWRRWHVDVPGDGERTWTTRQVEAFTDGLAAGEQLALTLTA
jgi:hypothetical protein